MHVTGGCFCGQVTYEAEVDPEQCFICHCTDCQRNSGTGWGAVVVTLPEGFRLLSGVLKGFVKTADSGAERLLSFCPECGTRIHASAPGNPAGYMGLRLGTVDQRAELPPKAQVYCRSALPWALDISHLPRFEGSRRDG